MNVEKLREIFILESEGMLQQMEDALMRLQIHPDDKEATNLLFRATHTMKGSSGLVEFTAIAELTHAMEDVLDKLRREELSSSKDFINLILACRDHISELLEHPAQVSEPNMQQARQELLSQLQTIVAATTEPEKTEPEKVATPPPLETTTVQTTQTTAAEAVATVTVLEETKVADNNWHISLRFHEDALRSGVEPLALLRYLNEFGTTVNITPLFDAMPNIADMQPEHCYLGFEIEFHTALDKNAIENLFELVYNHCQVRILPPHSLLSSYIQLIRELPENTMRLGEILVKSGTLTARELEMGLVQQQIHLSQQKQESASDTEANKIGRILVKQGVVAQDVVNAALAKQSQVEQKKTRTHRTLHVDADKLDQLINLVGELVIASASIDLQTAASTDERLREATALMLRLVEDIRDRTLGMRMVRIHETFNRFPRVVYELCDKLGKKVDLVINGADTELDKSMVEKITEPLIHLVRNAIDHGIEPPQTRLAQGKPETGMVSLNAYHDSGSVIIEVSDDGAGLDRQKILAKAKEKGLIAADRSLSEEEIDQLIFEPAFSTSNQVTEVSGRGVGLDIVKRNISAQNGWISIHSTLNQGMTIRICLPLTLAIIDGFLLSVGDSTYVIPLDRVVECVELTPQVEKFLQRDYINLRGKVLPLLRLREVFNVKQDCQSSRNVRESIIVVGYGNCQAGLVVDALLGECQTVIKPLGKLFEKLAGISGATILGSGEVALILDVAALIQQYGVADNGKKHTLVRKI